MNRYEMKKGKRRFLSQLFRRIARTRSSPEVQVRIKFTESTGAANESNSSPNVEQNEPMSLSL